MQSKIETITPERAEELLGKNENNRLIRRRKVDEFATSIKRGDWQLNGEAIKIDHNGRLIDGQHRLHAVVLAGQPITTLVVYGLDPLSQKTMDQGTKRQLSDTLKWMGEINAVNLASTLRVTEHFYRTGQVTTQNHSFVATKDQLIDFLNEHPGIRDCINVPHRGIIGKLLTPSVAASLYYLFNQVSTADAQMFFHKLGSGEGLIAGDPILGLRKVLDQNAMRNHSKMNTKYRAAITIKAFNSWRRGDTVKLVKWTSGGAFAEPFPRIDGFDYEPIDKNKTIKEDTET